VADRPARPVRHRAPLSRTTHAGLVPVMRLAQRCGLPRLAAEEVKLTRVKNSAGAAADAKVTSIVAGWAHSLARAGRPLIRGRRVSG
jgi:hypothetical protein